MKTWAGGSSMHAQKPAALRCVVIVADGERVTAWQAQCLNQIRGISQVDIVGVVVMRGQSHSRRRVTSLLGYAYEGWLRRRGRSLRRGPLSAVLPGVPVVEVVESVGVDLSLRQLVQETMPDILLNLTEHPVTPEGCSLATYGVWFFHFGNHSAAGRHAGVPGWREVTTVQSMTKVTLFQQTKDGLFILQEGRYRTQFGSPMRNVDKCHEYGVDWPARACRAILAGSEGWRRVTSTCVATSVGFARFPVRLARVKVKFARFKAKFLSEHWNVGIIHAPLDSIMDGHGYPSVEWLDDCGKDGFLADPFPFADDEGGLTIFVEAYDYRTTKGSITALRYESEPRTVSRTTRPQHFRTHTLALHSSQVIWHFPWHTSYPYLFEAEGHMYCVPETHQARQVTLYRARRYPYEWEEIAVLIEGFPAVDSTLFQFGDYWWLFCTDADSDPDSQLHVWYADNLLGPWQPHCLNPVKSDVRSSRPAGRPFWRDGSLYRPSQDCSQSYGGRVVLNRIDCLTPTEFEEVAVSAIEPPVDSPYSFGLHTLNTVGDLTIIDGKSYKFVPAYVWGELKQKISSKFRRVPGGRRVRSEHVAWYRNVKASGKAPEPWRPE